MQGMKGPSLVQEDPTCLGRTKPTTTESMHAMKEPHDAMKIHMPQLRPSAAK